MKIASNRLFMLVVNKTYFAQLVWSGKYLRFFYEHFLNVMKLSYYAMKYFSWKNPWIFNNIFISLLLDWKCAEGIFSLGFLKIWSFALNNFTEMWRFMETSHALFSLSLLKTNYDLLSLRIYKNNKLDIMIMWQILIFYALIITLILYCHA